MEVEIGKKILDEDPEIKLVLLKSGEVLYKSRARGIAPMYDIAMNHRGKAEGATVVDRVIGRGAAIIAAHIGIRQVYGELVSDGAKEILEKNDISYSFLQDTSYIQNRTKTDYCPIEKLSMGNEEGENLLKKVGEFLEEIRKNK